MFPSREKSVGAFPPYLVWSTDPSSPNVLNRWLQRDRSRDMRNLILPKFTKIISG
jgi:hypothetical protein